MISLKETLIAHFFEYLKLILGDSMDKESE